MKWQRGLFRLWIVLSAFWIAGVGAVTWATFPEQEYITWHAPPQPPDNKEDLDKFPGLRRPQAHRDWLSRWRTPQRHRRHRNLFLHRMMILLLNASHTFNGRQFSASRRRSSSLL